MIIRQVTWTAATKVVGTMLLAVALILLCLFWIDYRSIIGFALKADLAGTAERFWQHTKDFLSSVFFTAIIGSLAGAFAGAYGGQLIVERGKGREQLLSEIRNTNASIVISLAICNTLLSMKGQHLKRLRENFEKQKKEVFRRHENIRSGLAKEDGVFEFTADFQTIFLSHQPLDILQTQIFEKLSPPARVSLLTTTLRQAIDNLRSSIELRNQLIGFYKSRSPLPDNQLISVYFGLPYNDGHVNQDYPSALEAIFNQTDDGIFFSSQLCVHLREHGEMTAASYRRKFGEGAPPINKPDFSKAESSDLMPSADKYADWVGGIFATNAARDPAGMPGAS